MKKLKSNEFQCYMCKGWFTKTRPESEALAEKERLWGDIPLEELAVICDDCFKIVDPEKPENGERYTAALLRLRRNKS